LHTVYPNEQSMSGVFSIASHWVLQYLPDVVTHEQNGCAHFAAFAVAISISPNFGLTAANPRRHLKHRGKAFLSDKAHIFNLVTGGRPQMLVGWIGMIKSRIHRKLGV
jgi:hypothetical protein